MNNSNLFNTLSLILLTPLLILNIFSGIIASVWLLTLGRWDLIIYSMGMIFLLPVIFSFIYLPSAGLTSLGIKLLEKEKNNLFLCNILIFISLLYLYFVVRYFIFYVFEFFISQSNLPVIPLLLLGYSISVGVFQYMASQDKSKNREANVDDTGTFPVVLFSQLIYIILTTFYLIGVETNIKYISNIITVVYVTILFIYVSPKLKALVQKNILFIEDEQAIVTIISESLRGNGYNVHSLYDTENAYDILNSNKIDLIVTGIMLPKQDGIDFLREIKNNSNFKNIPYVIFSNLDTKEIQDTVKELGAIKFISKSKNTLDDFVNEVKKILKP